MNRAHTAAVVMLTVLGTAGCASSSEPGTDVDRPAVSSLVPANPQRGSACLTTPMTGDSRVMVDWVDFVQLHGTQYLAGLDGKVPPVASDQLGPTVGRVECQLSVLKFQAQPGPAVDGDAAFLKVGTDVRAIRGYEPSCGVAARVEGSNRVYLAHVDAGGISSTAAQEPAAG